ncbi:uncharacterized protein LOC101004671 [Papio anubis]|uniref:Uncharacterized protein n=1 Tax=Papio anubis TaxID=9555 RepID=A0A8I5R857_PAPAN|nr:uncharacterized protein LOC101004671 [Papio anubis]
MQSVWEDRGKEKPEPGLELRRAESCGLPSGLGDAVREHELRVPEGPERYSAIGSDHQVGDTAIVEGAMEPGFRRKLQRCALSPATNDIGVTSEDLLIILPLLGIPRGMQFRSAASIRTPSSQHAQWPLPGWLDEGASRPRSVWTLQTFGRCLLLKPVVSMGWVMEEWMILLNLNPKLANWSPVSSTGSRPSGFRPQSFSREPSTWCWQRVMRRMYTVVLALQWSSLDASSSPDSTFLFLRLFRDSGSRLSQLGSQTLRPGRVPHAQAHGSAARSFPTVPAKQNLGTKPLASPQAASLSTCRIPRPPAPTQVPGAQCLAGTLPLDMLLNNRFGPGAVAHDYL